MQAVTGALLDCQLACCPPKKNEVWDDPSLSKKTRIDLLSNAVEDALQKGDMGPFFKWGNALQESLVSAAKKKKKKPGVSHKQMRDHCDAVFNAASECQKLDSVPQLQPAVESLGVPPSLREVEEVCKSLRTGTAPGASGIDTQLLKLGGEALWNLLKDFFTTMWPEEYGGGGADLPLAFRGANVTPIFKNKGSEDCPGNYRTIFLLEVVGKALFQLLNRRLEPLAESALWDCQNGFRANRGVNHSALCLKLLQQHAADVSAPLCVLFLDVKKAFDSIPRPLIMQALESIGVPYPLIRFYEQVHTDVICRIGGKGESFTMGRGVRQGSPEGPVLFALAYQLILQQALANVPGNNHSNR